MNKLLTAANIRPGEGKVVAWVLLYAILSSTAYLLASTTAYALFLSTFDAQRLPYIYIGGSVFTTLISLLTLHLGKRYSLSQLLVGQLILILLTMIGYRIGLAVMTGRWFIFSLPIWDGVVSTIIYTALWNLLGRLFNLQQGKRLFSLIGAGQQIAALAVGLLIPLLVAWFGTPNLLVIAAVAGGGALGVLLYITHTFHALQAPEAAEMALEPEPEAEPSISGKGLFADAYIWLIFVMYICFALGSYFIDNIFYAQVETQYPNADQIASFLGAFGGVVGAFSLFSQLFIAPRLLSRYGVRIAILLTPVSLLIGVMLFTLIGTFSHLLILLFWLAVCVNLTLQVMDASDNTAANLLYQPLPAALRTHTQTTVDGIIAPVTVGLTGLLLLGLTNFLHLDSLHLAYVLLPILAGWALVASLLGRAYPRRVQQALRQRIIQGNTGFQPDRASLDLLQQSLTNDHPGLVIYALNVLEEANPEALARSLPALLEHPSPAVRLDVLARLERRGEIAQLTAISQCFHREPDPGVRSAALRTLATIGGLDSFEEVYVYLTTPERQLKQGVMVGLLRSGELECVLAVGATLAQLVNSTDATERSLAAQVLGESGIASFYRPLLTLLQDADPLVQRAALAATGQLQNPKLWPVVISCLASPKTRSAAQAALVAGGEATLVELKAAFARTSAGRQLWIELVRTCGRIRHPQVAALLLPYLDFPNVQARTHLLTALCQCGYRVSAATQSLVEQQLLAEFGHATWTLAALNDLADNAALALLQAALIESLVQQRVRLLLWLSLLYEPSMMLRARDALGLTPGIRRQPSTEQRAYALETLDLLIANPFKPYLLTLLDDLAPAQMLARLAVDFPQPSLSPADRLHTIIIGDEAWVNPWVKAIALYTVVTQFNSPLSQPILSQAILQEAATTALNSSAGLVGETATWALAMVRLDKFTGQAQLGITPGGAPTNGASGWSKQIMEKEGDDMLLTIEKVMILKTVDIFAATPDEILVEIAALLKEIIAPAGTMIFEKGKPGDSMYIIVTGEVEALDGERVFTRMGERQVFGEMALLDGEPRTASIRTTQATRLLRLDQEPFYELMDDRIEVARGIIHVLLQRLRARTDDVNKLRAELNTLAAQSR